MLRKHSWCGALFDSDGHFNMSRRVGILWTGFYARANRERSSSYCPTYWFMSVRMRTILDVVKTSLDRRRRSVKTFTVKKPLTQREVSYVAT
jgi:hypothetical protein